MWLGKSREWVSTRFTFANCVSLAALIATVWIGVGQCSLSSEQTRLAEQQTEIARRLAAEPTFDVNVAGADDTVGAQSRHPHEISRVNRAEYEFARVGNDGRPVAVLRVTNSGEVISKDTIIELELQAPFQFVRVAVAKSTGGALVWLEPEKRAVHSSHDYTRTTVRITEVVDPRQSLHVYLLIMYPRSVRGPSPGSAAMVPEALRVLVRYAKAERAAPFRSSHPLWFSGER